MSFPRYLKYKDSGVEWLGEVPEGWKIQPIKAFASCNDDVLGESTEEDYELEYVEISDVDASRGISGSTLYRFKEAPSRARRQVKSGDVIVSTVRTYLRAIAPVHNPPDNLIVSTGFSVIRSKSATSGFIGYFFLSEYLVAEIISRSVGVSYPAINASQLMGLLVALPPEVEQQIIAAFLDRETAKIDALVAEQENLIALLKEKRQAVISHAVTKGLDPTVPMKNSGIEWLGGVPAHWNITRLSKLISTWKGIAFKAEFFCDDGVLVVKASDIKYLTIKTPNSFLPFSFCQQFPQAILRSGEIIVSTVGSAPEVKNSAVGQIGQVPNFLTGALLNQNTVVFRSGTEFLLDGFLFVALQTTRYRDHLDLHAHGTANQMSLNVADMLGFFLPLPSPSEQEAIIEFLDRETTKLDTLTTEAQHTIDLLKERRSALISAAVTGKIDVRNSL